MTHFSETMTVHAGRTDLRNLGVHALPLDFSSTYPIQNLTAATAALDVFVQGAECPQEPIYGRLYNPTVARFEAALASLEETEAAVAFGSGMAAMTACLLAARQEGGHLVATRPIYGSTDHLLSCGLLGFEVTWTSPDKVQEALRPDTALVVMETPSNPLCTLLDIEAVVAQAGHVPVLVDSTFATPILQKPAQQGAALVLHSATKYLGGHGDVIAGVVASNEAWAQRLRQVRILTGGLLHPMGAYLLHRGLPTLALRMEKAQANAQVLAERLGNHALVQAVHYPGLPKGDPQGLLGRQMKGAGAMLAFEVEDYRHAVQVMQKVRLITPAVSLGSVDTLIQHPAGLTHRIVNEGARQASGIHDGLLRLSVGVEHVEDLWQDLAQGLSSN